MTVSELNMSELQQIGPDLVLHTPTSLVIHTGSESSPARVVDILAVKNGDFALFEEAKIPMLRHFTDPFTGRIGCNFIVSYHPGLASLVTPEELLICGHCNMICFTSPPPTGLHEYHMTGFCAGSTEPLIKCMGLRIHGDRFLFVVLHETALQTSPVPSQTTTTTNPSVSRKSTSADNATSLFIEKHIISLRDPSDPESPVFRRIGANLVLHTKLQLAFICKSSTSVRLINPVKSLGTAAGFRKSLFESEEALKSNDYPWSPYYKLIFERDHSCNFHLIDDDPTLSTEHPSYPLEICGGCKRVCVPCEEKSKVNERWFAHMAESPSCSNADKIPCRGLKTVQKPMRYLVLRTPEVVELLQEQSEKPEEPEAIVVDLPEQPEPEAIIVDTPEQPQDQEPEAIVVDSKPQDEESNPQTQESNTPASRSTSPDAGISLWKSHESGEPPQPAVSIPRAKSPVATTATNVSTVPVTLAPTVPAVNPSPQTTTAPNVANVSKPQSVPAASQASQVSTVPVAAPVTQNPPKKWSVDKILRRVQELADSDKPEVISQDKIITASKLTSLLPKFASIAPGIVFRFIQKELQSYESVEARVEPPNGALVATIHKKIQLTMYARVTPRPSYYASCVMLDLVIRATEVLGMPLERMVDTSSVDNIERITWGIAADLKLFTLVVRVLAEMPNQDISLVDLKEVVQKSFRNVKVERSAAFEKVGAYLKTVFPDSV